MLLISRSHGADHVTRGQSNALSVAQDWSTLEPTNLSAEDISSHRRIDRLATMIINFMYHVQADYLSFSWCEERHLDQTGLIVENVRWEQRL